MNDAVRPTPAALLDTLRLLCAQPSVAGQARGLADGADIVASILRDVGLECHMLKTAGAPIVIGRYDSGAPRTLLLYSNYDVPPAGLRRSWTNDPFQPAVRDDALYARGAVIKAELVARAAAIRTLIAQRVPLNIVMIVEGERLAGSPHLAEARAASGPGDLCLWNGGGFAAEGIPLLYTGVKGLLQVELQATTATAAVPATYAATVPNPIWTLIMALAGIKSEFEEILIEGFYDEIAPPSRQALNAVQKLDVGEQARREAWGVERFIANVKGAMLARTETFSPTIGITAVNVGSASGPAIPQRASAELQFQLVPDLRPERLFALLTAHLQTHGFDTIQATQLPGAYPPTAGGELPFDAAKAAVSVYGKEARIVPLAPFTAPAALLAPESPLLSCGLERPSSALFGPDEHVPIKDVIAHTQLLIEIITRAAV